MIKEINFVQCSVCQSAVLLSRFRIAVVDVVHLTARFSH